jgi:hypothetical protein
MCQDILRQWRKKDAMAISLKKRIHVASFLLSDQPEEDKLHHAVDIPPRHRLKRVRTITASVNFLTVSGSHDTVPGVESQSMFVLSGRETSHVTVPQSQSTQFPPELEFSINSTQKLRTK